MNFVTGAIRSWLPVFLGASILTTPLAHGDADPFHCFEDDGVLDTQTISANDGALKGPLAADECFGRAVEGIGDLDGDGINDLAVGATDTSSSVISFGAV